MSPLYRAFGENGNPTLGTLTKVFGALGVRFSVAPAEPAAKSAAA